jgi:hypothetical protein
MALFIEHPLSMITIFSLGGMVDRAGTLHPLEKSKCETMFTLSSFVTIRRDCF